MEKHDVFKNVKNEIRISDPKKEQLRKFIKCFLSPYKANKFLSHHNCNDIKEVSENILGFKIGLKDFLTIMLDEGFPIKPSSNDNIIGYYKLKPDFYNTIGKIVTSLNDNNISITLKNNKEAINGKNEKIN